jgi:hypothetical protein
VLATFEIAPPRDKLLLCKYTPPIKLVVVAKLEIVPALRVTPPYTPCPPPCKSGANPEIFDAGRAPVIIPLTDRFPVIAEFPET